MIAARAMILAAGLGTRMRPLTNDIPKPLIPVTGKPLIDWCLDWLGEASVHEVVINSSYRAQQLEEYLARRVTPKIHVSREEPEPLETGGGILKALPLLGSEPFLVMNSDAILPLDGEHPLDRMRAAWSDDLDFLMLLVPREMAIGWNGDGDFVADMQGRIRRPYPGEDAPFIFTGIEIMHPRAFTECPEGKFSLNLLWKRLEQPDGWHRRMKAVIHEGPWLNVGDLEGLRTAESFLAR